MKECSIIILCIILLLAGCQYTPSNTSSTESNAAVQTTDNSTHEEPADGTLDPTETTSSSPVIAQRFTFSHHLVRGPAKDALGQDYALYCKLVDAYINHDETISGFSSEDQFRHLFSILQNEYYPAEKIAATFKTHTNPFVYSNGAVTLRYQYDQVECDSYIRDFENKINAVLSIIEDNDTDVEIIEKLYHHVCTTMSYNSSFNSDKMYDYIMQDSGKNDIFDQYFELLLRCAGIECLSCYAVDDSDETRDTSWIIAKMNGSYYHFDPSWQVEFGPVDGWHWFAMSDNARLRSLTNKWSADMFAGINPYTDSSIAVPEVDIGRSSPYYTADPLNVPTCTSTYYDEKRFDAYSPPSTW